MSAPFISIVVPVFRVEKFLETGVGALLRQTYRDFELILIDDCSPDNSPAICDALAQTDDRIRVIHLEKNGGVSNARNIGIDVARGQYVLFIDSDDICDADLVETLVAAVQKNETDIVVYGLLEEHFDENDTVQKTVRISLPTQILTGASEVRKVMLDLERTTLYGYPWNKLYSLAYLREHNVRFPAVRFNEDILFNIDAFMDLERCTILDITPYHYAKRVNASTTSRFIPTYFADIMLKIDGLYRQLQYWDMLTEEALTLVAALYSRYVFSALERNLDKRMGMNRKARKAFFDAELKTERYANLCTYLGGGGVSGVMAKAFKAKNRFLCLTIAAAINFIKKHLPQVFEKLS